jgi:hypothetical protein
MIELIKLFWTTLESYGPIGLLAFAGWGVTGFLFYKDYRKKAKVSTDIKTKDNDLKAKDKLIEQKNDELVESKDKLADTIREMSNERLTDLKELVADYNSLANNMTATLDRVADALEIKASGDEDDK